MIETVMTYKDWEMEYKKRQKLKSKKFLYFIKQKVIGLLAIVAALVIPIFLNGDGTISIFLLPTGIALFFTKERAIIWY